MARAQHGVFTRRQAVAAGLSENQIEHRLRIGRWMPIAPSVYATASSLPTWERQLSAALLSRPGSVAAGVSAAFLHRFDDFRQAKPQIMIGSEANGRLSIGRVMRITEFDQVARARVGGFPVTSVAETMWTLAGSIGRQRLRDLIDQQVSMGNTRSDQLMTVLDRVEGSRRRGLPSFREAVLATSPASESTAANVLEVLLYALLNHPDVPAVNRQQPFLLDEPARVDAYIPSWLLVVEADGRNWHSRQSDFQRDRTRDNRLGALGVIVVRFTYDDLKHRFDDSRTTLIATGRHRSAMTMK